MNPIYAIMESPYRWLILASISFTAGFVGAIVFLVYGWSQTAARVWFYLALALTLYYLWRAFQQWKSSVADLASGSATQTDTTEEAGQSRQ